MHVRGEVVRTERGYHLAFGINIQREFQLITVEPPLVAVTKHELAASR